ncbi:MAG: protein kinase [Planctomycetota bacterium]|nr:protein kinase [Planctomycetota bacterium]
MNETFPSPASQREADLSGQQLGDYHLLRRLGSGAMAEVYLARQVSLDRDVAFKVLKSSLTRDENCVRRFQQEARAAASLVHANIVQIYEVGCLGDRHYLAQEYVAGGTVRQWLAGSSGCSAGKAVAVVRQVAAALECASQQGVIHRDIKPENILLTKNGEAKVADFGLARLAISAQTVDLKLTQQGLTLGTPLYMSPEQIQGGHVDPRSDLYSLGVTAYEILAGTTPFAGETALNVAVQHLHEEAARLETLRADLPISLCDIVHKLLGKKPDERYESATELIQDLHGLGLDDSDSQWHFAENAIGSTLTIDNARLDATRKLDALMKVEAARLPTRRMVSVVGLGLICGTILGTAWAYLRMPGSILEVTYADHPRVEKKKSARLQYLHAILEPSQPSWEAVTHYFGGERQTESRQYVSKANAELAHILFDQGRVLDALSLYRELADLGEDLIEQRALGLAGMANIYQARGNRNELSVTLVRLTTDLEKLGGRAQGVIRVLDSPLRERMSRVQDEQRLQAGRRPSQNPRRGGKLRRKSSRFPPRRSGD